MSGLIEERQQALAQRLTQMRDRNEWYMFQNFVLNLLSNDGYTDVRLSPVRSDFGRDGVAITPQGQKCFVAVSFTCTLAKIRHDAKRWIEDPNREDATVILFATDDSPQNTKVSEWKAKVKRDYGLELRIYNHQTILSTATREGVWRETCAMPRTVIMTTPNIEYNVRFETLQAGKCRHRDHRFEWTRTEFRAWANTVAERLGYAIRFALVGPEDSKVGSPTQIGVFDMETER